MYRHFVEEHGNICTYETFRKTLKEANISFTRLGSEECDICKTYSIHVKDCHVDDDCEICADHSKHLKNAEESRSAYQEDRDRRAGRQGTIVSVDMMRVTVLPILPHKVCVFTPRLIAYNETFSPLGGGKVGKALSVTWHEGIAGRDASDVASTFIKFCERHRDT